jgi:murein DD-endopeptidase MepM/ murein hydrolase activator NlpD
MGWYAAPRRLPALLGVLALAAAALLSGPAVSAQDGGPTTTPVLDDEEPVFPSTTTTTTTASDDGDDPAERPPGVPPPEEPDIPEPDPLPDPAEVRTAQTEGERVAFAIRQRVRTLWQARVDAAGDVSDDARDKVDDLTRTYLQGSADVADRGSEFDEAQVAYRAVVDDYRADKRTYSRRLTIAYVRGPAIQLNELLSAADPLQPSTRTELVRSVLERAQHAVTDSFLRAASLDPQFDTEAAGLTDARDELAELRIVRELAQRRLAEANDVVEDEAALASDVLFPVDGQYQFIDSFLAPRYVGGRFHHRHQGADIFAAHGTPLVAVERGVLFRIGTGTLGGIKLWLLGESGTAYYYAHLARYADVVGEGVFVEAGTVIGYVGDTGNARGGAPHLHFEVRPGGGAAVNPTPLLRQLAERDGVDPSAKPTTEIGDGSTEPPTTTAAGDTAPD